MVIIRKKLKITTPQTLRKKSKFKEIRSSLTACCIKCNKPFAAITALIIFTSVLGVVIYNIENRNKTTAHHSIIQSRMLVSRDEAKCTITRLGSLCDIKCSNFNEGNIETLSAVINGLNLKVCSRFQLRLESTDFINATIKCGWLNDLIIEIEELFIQTSNLMIIDEYAFSLHPFTDLINLSLYETKIEELKQVSFLGSSITNFQFSLNALKPIRVEENVFTGISSQLQILQFLQCLEIVDILHNITGIRGTSLENVIEIDLRLNNLKKLTNSTFIKTPNVLVLHLQNAGIEAMEASTFQQLTKLVSLNIADNKLTTMPEGIFDFISTGKIFITGNSWNCNCELVWLRDFYTEFIELFSDDFDCLVNNKYEYYEIVDFCPDNTTTSTSKPTLPTTSTPLITTTAKASDYIELIKINCQDVANYPMFMFANLQRLYSHSVMIRQQTVVFSFFQLENEPSFEVQIAGNVSLDSLLWINSENITDINCLCNMGERVLLQKLSYAKTYTVCLLEQNQTGVSPYDCTALTVPPDWGSQTWIPNKLMFLVIGIICSSFVAIALLSSLIVFYCIRQHPNLIRGNKRVIIVESKAADAIVMPKTYDKLNYNPPSLKSCSDGYLTPKNKIYYTAGKISTLPIITENMSRLSHSLSVNKSRRSQGKRRGKVQDFVESFDFHVYEPPPPLPPNHPAEKFAELASNHL